MKLHDFAKELLKHPNSEFTVSIELDSNDGIPRRLFTFGSDFCSVQHNCIDEDFDENNPLNARTHPFVRLHKKIKRRTVGPDRRGRFKNTSSGFFYSGISKKMTVDREYINSDEIEKDHYHMWE